MRLIDDSRAQLDLHDDDLEAKPDLLNEYLNRYGPPMTPWFVLSSRRHLSDKVTDDQLHDIGSQHDRVLDHPQRRYGSADLRRRSRITGVVWMFDEFDSPWDAVEMLSPDKFTTMDSSPQVQDLAGAGSQPSRRMRRYPPPTWLRLQFNSPIASFIDPNHCRKRSNAFQSWELASKVKGYGRSRATRGQWMVYRRAVIQAQRFMNWYSGEGQTPTSLQQTPEELPLPRRLLDLPEEVLLNIFSFLEETIPAVKDRIGGNAFEPHVNVPRRMQNLLAAALESTQSTFHEEESLQYVWRYAGPLMLTCKQLYKLFEPKLQERALMRAYQDALHGRHQEMARLARSECWENIRIFELRLCFSHWDLDNTDPHDINEALRRMTNLRQFRLVCMGPRPDLFRIDPTCFVAHNKLKTIWVPIENLIEYPDATLDRLRDVTVDFCGEPHQFPAMNRLQQLRVNIPPYYSHPLDLAQFTTLKDLHLNARSLNMKTNMLLKSPESLESVRVTSMSCVSILATVASTVRRVRLENSFCEGQPPALPRLQKLEVAGTSGIEVWLNQLNKQVKILERDQNGVWSSWQTSR